MCRYYCQIFREKISYLHQNLCFCCNYYRSPGMNMKKVDSEFFRKSSVPQFCLKNRVWYFCDCKNKMQYEVFPSPRPIIVLLSEKAAWGTIFRCTERELWVWVRPKIWFEKNIVPSTMQHTRTLFPLSEQSIPKHRNLESVLGSQQLKTRAKNASHVRVYSFWSLEHIFYDSGSEDDNNSWIFECDWNFPSRLRIE